MFNLDLNINKCEENVDDHTDCPNCGGHKYTAAFNGTYSEEVSRLLGIYADKSCLYCPAKDLCPLPGEVVAQLFVEYDGDPVEAEKHVDEKVPNDMELNNMMHLLMGMIAYAKANIGG